MLRIPEATEIDDQTECALCDLPFVAHPAQTLAMLGTGFDDECPGFEAPAPSDDFDDRYDYRD